ncbi:hypothetical protein [Cyanobium sp. PCC 7001]|uniref:hypothetical protein n=1 Tax=Cyanobium sp. PCC 7001 TaxID=180281 RepID=UPI00032006B5|nr:hypothetical protein [Cyanobium sp. PCC 7001]
MPELPSTTTFPAEPDQLEREELETVYLELRSSYRSLMISRGVYRGQAQRGREAMTTLEQRLWAIAAREASVRREAYEMLEIVTTVIGDLEDAGDDLTNEFALYQKGRTTYAGGGFLGRLIRAVISFIGRWTKTKQNLDTLLEKQQTMRQQLDQGSSIPTEAEGTVADGKEADGKDR